MQVLDLKELAIYEFNPNNIIMIHKSTKLLYQYFQNPSLTFKQNHILHQNLLTAIILPTGILYLKGVTSLAVEINKRVRMTNKHFYEEQELINTFSPVLQCLQFLHSKDIVHANISALTIIFNDEGEVQLRDWLIQIPNNKYYQKQKLEDRTQSDDLQALGNVLLEISTLSQFSYQNENQHLENSLRKMINKYSRGFILAVFVMMKKFDKYYPNLLTILSNNEAFIESNDQLIEFYSKIKGQKQSKPISPTFNTNCFAKGVNCLSNGTNFNKNVQFTNKYPMTKKNPKIEDLQNKKHFQEQIKKKNTQRITKIVQKNTNFQIMKKTDMALKKVSNYKFNILSEKQIDKPFKKSTKEEVLKFGSPIKRLRTNPKKKNI